jgi:putative glutamine amidotransferase
MHPFHRCSEKYLLAVINPIGGTPVILPALPELGEFAEYIDGLLLTGSPSNVEPAQYRGKESEEGTRHDSYRDGTILPLIKECLKEKNSYTWFMSWNSGTECGMWRNFAPENS